MCTALLFLELHDEERRIDERESASKCKFESRNMNLQGGNELKRKLKEIDGDGGRREGK